jgi:hypothetical protein
VSWNCCARLAAGWELTYVFLATHANPATTPTIARKLEAVRTVGTVMSQAAATMGIANATVP